MSGVIRIPETVLMQPSSGEIMFLNLSDNCYYGLEPIGSRMFALLMERDTIDEVVACLESEYATTADVLHSDVRKLIDDLVASGLVEVVGAVGEPPAPTR